MHRYQLVLQFPASGLDDFDWLVEAENRLIAALSGKADVDGHDFGSGEMNVFIYTDTPEATFETARAALGKDPRLGDMAAAYREVQGEDYTILWPPGRTVFTVA